MTIKFNFLSLSTNLVANRDEGTIDVRLKCTNQDHCQAVLDVFIKIKVCVVWPINTSFF